MRVILPAAPADTLRLLSGYDQVVTGMSTFGVGDGSEDVRGHSHIRIGIVNNVVANSQQGRNLDTGETFGMMWDAPKVLNFRFHEFLLAAQGSVGVCIGEWPSVAAPHTNLRTNATVRRLMYLAERDAGGTITHYLVTCDGAARSETIIAAPAINDKISMLWRTAPRAFQFYRNGSLRHHLTVTLPALGASGRFIAGYGVWKTPASAVRNHLRMFAFGVMVGQEAL